ncbi:MAG: ROK family protein [Saprospiraceae bacterium]
MKESIILGVDIGGSGIKGGLIDITTGQMIGERFRLETPQPATPEAMAQTFAAVVAHFEWKGAVGAGFPAIVHNGVAMSASNIHETWIGIQIERLLSEATGCKVHVVNDADAAGIAIMRYGIGKGEKGVVVVLTIGTGIGSAMFVDGQLVPNTEFGHLYMRNKKEVAEKQISGGVRKAQGLSWQSWGKRFNKYLHHLDRLLSPDLVILGGGDSKYFDQYEKYINVDYIVKPATYLNKAGAVSTAFMLGKQNREILPNDSLVEKMA